VFPHVAWFAENFKIIWVVVTPVAVLMVDLYILGGTASLAAFTVSPKSNSTVFLTSSTRLKSWDSSRWGSVTATDLHGGNFPTAVVGLGSRTPRRGGGRVATPVRSDSPACGTRAVPSAALASKPRRRDPHGQGCC